MTQEGQKTHNFPTSVRIWGKYDILPASWVLENEMKKQQATNYTQGDSDDKIIPFKDDDTNQPKSVDQHST